MIPKTRLTNDEELKTVRLLENTYDNFLDTVYWMEWIEGEMGVNQILRDAEIIPAHDPIHQVRIDLQTGEESCRLLSPDQRQRLP